MSAAVRQREDRPRVEHHLANGLEIPIRIAEKRQIDETGASTLHHYVVDDLEGLAPFPGRDRRDALVRCRFIVGRVSQGEHHGKALHDQKSGTWKLPVIRLAV